MKTLLAFLLGMIEFRQDLTTHINGDYIETYDKGREFMHRLTLRRYDQ